MIADPLSRLVPTLLLSLGMRNYDYLRSISGARSAFHIFTRLSQRASYGRCSYQDQKERPKQKTLDSFKKQKYELNSLFKSKEYLPHSLAQSESEL